MSDTYSNKKLITIINNINEDKFTLGHLINCLGKDSFPLLNAFFALPCVIPLPAPPGYTTIFGLLIMFVSAQMFLNFKSFRTPSQIKKISLNKKIILNALIKTSKIQSFLEKFIKERKPEQFQTKYFNYQFSLLVFFTAFILALPIPVGNLLAGLSILILNLSYIRRDTLFYIIGIILSIIATITTLFLGIIIVAIIISSLNFIV